MARLMNTFLKNFLMGIDSLKSLRWWGENSTPSIILTNSDEKHGGNSYTWNGDFTL